MAEITRSPLHFGMEPSTECTCGRLKCATNDDDALENQAVQACLSKCYSKHARAHENMDYCSLVFMVRHDLQVLEFGQRRIYSSGNTPLLERDEVDCGWMGPTDGRQDEHICFFGHVKFNKLLIQEELEAASELTKERLLEKIVEEFHSV